MGYRSVSRTDPGQVRDVNEDSVYARSTEEWCLLVVADGMGGHAAGDVASENAVHSFVEYVESKLDNTTMSSVSDILIEGVHKANESLRAMIDDDPSLDGMGTTLVAAVLIEGTAVFVNVGDSRGYHVTPADIQQVTTDQSLVQELVEQGEITPEEAENHPQRNVVSQALGTQDSVEPEISSITTEGYMLVCSDGLTEEVSNKKIYETIRDSSEISDAAGELVEHANANGGSDNISLAIGFDQ